MRFNRWLNGVVAVTLLASVTACGSDDDDDVGSDTTASAASTVTTEALATTIATTAETTEYPDTSVAGTAESTVSTEAQSTTIASVAESLAPVEDQEITIAIAGEPPTLNPHTTSQPAPDVYTNIAETLIFISGTGEVTPLLAASLPENVEPDRWRIALREGVSFSDGEPFNAEAVKANFDRIKGLGEGEIFDRLKSITAVEVVDDLTVDFVTDGPDVVLPRRLIFLRLVSPAAFDTIDDHPIGTGPYELVEWSRGDRIELQRVDSYWGGPPPIAHATFVFLADPGTRLASLLSGEVDLMTDLSPDDTGLVPQSARSADNTVTLLNASVDEGSPAANVLFRRAVTHAIDRDAINEGLFGGEAFVPSGQPLDQTWFGYCDSTEPIAYDPDLSRELLAEAGAEGASITLGTLTRGRSPKNLEVYEVIAAQLEEVGLSVTINTYESSDIVKMYAGETPRDTFYGGNTSAATFDADLVATNWWYSETSRVSFTDPALDELVLAARQEFDPVKRQELYCQALEIVNENVYTIAVIGLPERVVGMTEDVQWEPGVGAITILKNISL